MSNIYVQSLTFYPLKSAAGNHVESIEVLNAGLLGDRRFMIAKMDATFVTGRTHPRITAIGCDYQAGKLVLKHVGFDDLEVNEAQLSSQYYQTKVWDSSFLGQGCGYQADQWISEVLGEPLRLLYFGDNSERPVIGHEVHSVGFADGFPLLIANKESLEHLNQRLPAPVDMAIFRPNIVISGAPAWDEDSWAQIKIGEAVFELPKPCSRCVFTTVDPITSTFDSEAEPLKTLTSYRGAPQGNQVIFGENMLVVTPGVIKVGDKVEILKSKEKPEYPDNWQPQKSRLALHLTQAKTKSTDTDTDSDSLQQSLRCVQIINETADVKTFVFTLKGAQRSAFLPGQFITIHPLINGQAYNRCYTLSSSPSKPDVLSLTIKRVDDGVVSNWLHDHFAVSSTLACTAPSGVFHLKHTDKRKILLLSAGSGITPMLSITRYITDLALDIDVHFHHSAKTQDDLIAIDELQLLAKQNANLTLSFNITRQDTADISGINTHVGRLCESILTNCCSDLLERDVMVCGPEAFMLNAKALVSELGLPDAQYDQESFEITTTEVTTTEQSHYKLTFLQSGIEVEIAGDQTILEAAEQVGIYPDYSCLAGICGSCNSQLVSGDIHAPDALAIDAEDSSNGEFLPCCSYARSDLEVDL